MCTFTQLQTMCLTMEGKFSRQKPAVQVLKLGKWLCATYSASCHIQGTLVCASPWVQCTDIFPQIGIANSGTMPMSSQMEHLHYNYNRKFFGCRHYFVTIVTCHWGLAIASASNRLPSDNLQWMLRRQSDGIASGFISITIELHQPATTIKSVYDCYHFITLVIDQRN